MNQSQSVSNADESEKCFVNVNLMEAKAIQLLDMLQANVVYSNVDGVIEFKQLCTMSETILNKASTQKDVDLLIKYLEVNQKLLVIEKDNRKYVKFTLNSNQTVSPLTQIELSYMELKETEKKLEVDTNKLSDEIESLNELIKSYLKQNNKTTAMEYLKKRKQIEKTLDTKDKTLANVQSMLMSIQQADTNQLTFNVYNKSAAALKEANKVVNLDKLDDTIQDLQDIMYANTEIEDAMAKSPLPSKYTFDDSELNKELADLLADNTRVKSMAKMHLDTVDESFDLSDMLSSLPQVPQDKLANRTGVENWFV